MKKRWRAFMTHVWQNNTQFLPEPAADWPNSELPSDVWVPVPRDIGPRHDKLKPGAKTNITCSLVKPWIFRCTNIHSYFPSLKTKHKSMKK